MTSGAPDAKDLLGGGFPHLLGERIVEIGSELAGCAVAIYVMDVEGQFAVRLSGAAEQFQNAVRINPQDADAHANLGSALAGLGKMSEAKLHFERALEINPEHSLARENLEQLRQAGGDR